MPPADAPLPPHPTLAAWYGDDAGKRPFLRRMFDATAGDYDRVERVLALGSGRWYRRRALARAGLTKGDRVLDVAMGTGLVAREAARLAGERVVGLDPSAGMLREARAALPAVPALQGVGERLPLAGASVDFVSMGYALRHLPDLHAAFAEFARVLKPGGKVCVLEITRPSGRVGRALLAAYFRALLPTLAKVAGTSADTRALWRYYGETIDQCVAPAVVLAALERAGLTSATRRVELGVFSAYVATKPV